MSRNVEAIAKILERHWNDASLGTLSYVLAEWLALNGVLAIDSLTDEQIDLLGDCAENDMRGQFRRDLRRCASGDPE